MIFKSNAIYTIIIVSIISNLVVIFQNYRYDILYKDKKDLVLVGIIISNKEEKEYKDMYKIKVINVDGSSEFKSTYLYIKIDKEKSKRIRFGDKIQIKGEYEKPEEQRNYKGFDYSKYLRTIKIYGIVKVDEVKIISKNNVNLIFKFSNNVSNRIKENIDNTINKDMADIFKGIILGETSNINEETYEKFRISSMAHILAVSGMHVSYVILGINLLMKNIIGKQKTRIIIIIILIIYMCITGFSPSVVRSAIMGILIMMSGLIHRKNDIWNSIAISLLIILIYNPYLILNVGLQLSYLGTIGIIVFYKNVFDILKNIKIKNKKIRYRINNKFILLMDKIKEILAVTISAQIMLLPVMLYHFNIYGPYFFISNILVSILIGPIIIVGGICIIISFFSIQVSKTISMIISFGIQMLLSISDISKWPFAKVYFATPTIFIIMAYYFLIIILNYLYFVYNLKKPTTTQVRIKNLIALAKYKYNQNKRKFIMITCFIAIVILISNKFPRKLKIHFIDVGQGDCTFIETPNNKTILIDGGGSLLKKFDVGKRTLLPYILDRGYTKIDYILISHFDEDHCRWIVICY